MFYLKKPLKPACKNAAKIIAKIEFQLCESEILKVLTNTTKNN